MKIKLNITITWIQISNKGLQHRKSCYSAFKINTWSKITNLNVYFMSIWSCLYSTCCKFRKGRFRVLTPSVFGMLRRHYHEKLFSRTSFSSVPSYWFSTVRYFFHRYIGDFGTSRILLLSPIWAIISLYIPECKMMKFAGLTIWWRNLFFYSGPGNPVKYCRGFLQ